MSAIPYSAIIQYPIKLNSSSATTAKIAQILVTKNLTLECSEADRLQKCVKTLAQKRITNMGTTEVAYSHPLGTKDS